MFIQPRTPAYTKDQEDTISGLSMAVRVAKNYVQHMPHCPTVASNKPSVNTAANGVTIGWLNVQSITNKSLVVRDLIDDRKFEVFVATETWHRHASVPSLARICGSDYTFVDRSREKGKGIVVFYQSYDKLSPLVLPEVMSFEYIISDLGSLMELILSSF